MRGIVAEQIDEDPKERQHLFDQVAARLKPGEDEELRKERDRLANAESLAQNAQEALAVLDEGFTEQNHMLNSTLKMVRGRIADYYRARIEYLYTPQGRSILSEQNRTIVSRMG